MSRLLVILAAAGLAASAQGAAVVATVDSSEPFQIQGKTVPKAGVRAWPVMAGERVATQRASALVTFKDGSRMLLDKDTQVTLLQKNGKVAVRIAHGQVAYRLSASNNVVFDSLEKSLDKVLPKAGVVSPQGLITDNPGLFAQFDRAASAVPDAPISLTYTNVPSGVEVVPGPPPESTYRGK